MAFIDGTQGESVLASANMLEIVAMPLDVIHIEAGWPSSNAMGLEFTALNRIDRDRTVSNRLVKPAKNVAAKWTIAQVFGLMPVPPLWSY
jgi:hypothetical protein